MSVPSDLESINKEIQKSFDNGAFRFLSEEEIRDWDGPIHHLAMNVSYKDSDTTPVRLCYDSSQPDKNGRTLNDCMSKGSNPINHFGSVILSFRSSENVACGDITKMFQRQSFTLATIFVVSYIGFIPTIVVSYILQFPTFCSFLLFVVSYSGFIPTFPNSYNS